MKFLITKDLNRSTLLSQLMGFVVFTIFLYLLLDISLHAYVIGADIESIKSTLFGNAENFEEPILIDSLLMKVHIDLFMTIFALLILSSIYIRLYSNTNSKMNFILHTLFISGLLAPLFLLLAYLWLEIFMYLWLFTFFLWHFMAFALIILIVKKLKFR